jgi:murein DD-endopeptidase MepM/ murein hydrolase activator NlpD
VGNPRHHTERRGLFLLFVLLALLPLAVLGLGPDAGVAQGQEGNVRVVGQGSAGFPSASGEGHVAGCAFQVDAAKDESGTSGSFTCELLDQAGSLGLPFTRINVEVTGLDAPSEQEATLEGPAVVELPSEESISDVPASVHALAGEPGTGAFQIHLNGVFDGEPGDEVPDDGDYTLVPQDVTEGSIDIQLEAPGPSPSPSVTPSESPGPSPSASPSPTPTPRPSPRPSPTPTVPPPQGPPDPGSGGPPPNQPDSNAPFTLGGTHSTARLMAFLAQLTPDGIPRLDDILSVVGPFPVAGLAWWHNDWHAPRCCPYPHLHQGLDLFAPRGTPVVAAVDGFVSQKVNGPISGLAVEIRDAGNTEYYYAHLSGFASGIAVGTPVRAGQILGYVGNTGNAMRTAPHLHFEIQPNGIPVPPMPIVDGWLQWSEQRALALVSQRTGGSLPDAATIRLWITKALALAGHDATGDVSDEGAISSPRPVSSLLDLHPSGPLVAFAAGALFLLVLMPAVLAGLRDARRGLVRARGGATGQSDTGTEKSAGEPPLVDEQPDPGGLGRHRPAAR